MTISAARCAREVLETVPLVMRFIRDQVRQRRAARLSVLQFRTLVFVKRTKNSSLSAVAEHLGLSLPATSRLINALVVDGLVGRRAVSTNRRQVALTLTNRGRATVGKVYAEIRRRLADSLKRLSAAEQRSVRRAMQVLHGVFGPDAGAGMPRAKV